MSARLRSPRPTIGFPVLLVVLPILAVFVPTASRAQEPLRIGTITIHTVDVYSKEEAAHGWPYRALAAVHVTTRSSTVRKFLLFKEGDVYSPEALAESERNLRERTFIRSASVVAGPPRDGVVDVTVTTQDTWTTEPSFTTARRGGVTTFGVSLLERNLAGTGREVELRYEEGVERITRTLDFIDPHFFRRYWEAYVLHGNNSDGGEDHGGIEKRFVSTGTRTAHSLRYDLARFTRSIYRGGEVAARYHEDDRSYAAEYGVALGRSQTVARRLTAGFQYEKRRYTPLDAYPDDPRPEDRNFRYLYLRGEVSRTELVKQNYVDVDSRYQDFDVGPRGTVLLGISPRALGPDRTTGFLDVELAKGLAHGLAHGNTSLVTGQLSYSRRLGRVTANAVASGDFRFFHRFGGPVRQTLVSRLLLLRGWDLDPENQFFADGSTGLRAYALYAYEGDRSAVWSVEHRLFLGRELLKVVAPGAVLFADVGTAAPHGEPLRLADVKSDIGAGLRFTLPRAAVHTVLRLDVAYPLNRDRDGNRSWLVSFSSSQGWTSGD